MPQNKPNMEGTLTVPNAKSLTKTTVKPQKEISKLLCDDTIPFEEWFKNFQVTATANHQKDLERRAEAKKGGAS